MCPTFATWTITDPSPFFGHFHFVQLAFFSLLFSSIFFLFSLSQCWLKCALGYFFSFSFSNFQSRNCNESSWVVLKVKKAGSNRLARLELCYRHTVTRSVTKNHFTLNCTFSISQVILLQFPFPSWSVGTLPLYVKSQQSTVNCRLIQVTNYWAKIGSDVAKFLFLPSNIY